MATEISFPLNILDPCKKLKCGENAICKVFFATAKAFCACPYLMVGDPYVKCGKLMILGDHADIELCLHCLK